VVNQVKEARYWGRGWRGGGRVYTVHMGADDGTNGTVEDLLAEEEAVGSSRTEELWRLWKEAVEPRHQLRMVGGRAG
jgi:hypothetical protein